MNKENNIHDSENGFPKGMPLRASDDYFENFSARLSDRIAGMEEIIPEAPLLSSIPRYNPFDVPAGYFDELPAIIGQKAAARPASFFSGWLLLLKPRFAVPVLSVLLVAFAGIRYMDRNAVSSSFPAAEELTVEDHLASIDEQTIIESLSSDAEFMQANADESIEDYLLENDIEESALN